MLSFEVGSPLVEGLFTNPKVPVKFPSYTEVMKYAQGSDSCPFWTECVNTKLKVLGPFIASGE